MKEGFIIKANWLVYRSAILKYLPLLGAKDSKKTFRSAKAIYCSEMKLLPEYEKYDVLKLNLSHAVMLSAIYESCEENLRLTGWPGSIVKLSSHPELFVIRFPKTAWSAAIEFCEKKTR